VRVFRRIPAQSQAETQGQAPPAPARSVSRQPGTIVQPSPAKIAQPAAIGDGWEVTSLEAAGMDRRPIEAMTAEIRRYSDWNIHAVLIEREGRLVYEEYLKGKIRNGVRIWAPWSSRATPSITIELRRTGTAGLPPVAYRLSSIS
jgi:hypothetical protein